MSSQNESHTSFTVKKAYIDTIHGQLHYHVSITGTGVAGPAQPLPVLLLHMSASSSKSFLGMMELLSALGYSCFAPDMPGFGGSFRPESDPPSIQWYADIYLRTFSKLDAFQNGCHIIGHHSGGVIGTELAAVSKGFVRSLTLVGPTVMSAEDRQILSKTFLDPFNKPDPSGAHLQKTWDYLLWEGISKDNLELLQREALDHIQAWEGRSQIYACVWKYDCAEAMERIDPICKVMAVCARDDVLWPYFENVKTVGRDVAMDEIRGGNFGPDLDAEGIVTAFRTLIYQ